jgi:MFS family permease
LEASQNSKNTLLAQILAYLNSYKNSFARPINSRYDIVLLGGALGSLFSLCQAIASPVIGRLSDRYGRRRALLCSMIGNIASVALWVAAVDFRTFIASRVVGGLSEGNVQLATAIATDISTDSQRGATMALVGACFSVAFTVGPALGAYLASITSVAKNPFATAAGFSLFLIVVETLYLYKALPETLPVREKIEPQTNGSTKKSDEKKVDVARTNPIWLLSMTHFLFVFVFSGMEFSLPFMTYDLFRFTSADSGKMLGYMGLIASILQGAVVRRMHPLQVVKAGVLSCAAAFFLLGNVKTSRGLYTAATLLAITSGTVVTGLNSLSSFEAAKASRGSTLGNHRSWGKFSSTFILIFLLTLTRSNRSCFRTTSLLHIILVGRKTGSLHSWRNSHAWSYCIGIWSIEETGWNRGYWSPLILDHDIIQLE